MVINKLKDYLRERFHTDVRKLPVHTFLGCPHREHRNGKGGCVYCDNSAFSMMDETDLDVARQIQEGITRARERGYTGKFIAYYQTGTNTYADPETLKSLWRPVYDFPEDIVGLSVGTRPDCLPENIITLLADFAEHLTVWIELGLQSSHDGTLRLINRGHDYACFLDAVLRLQKYEALLICVHIILGLPGESVGDMKKTLHELNRLKVHGLKLHHLQIVRDTKLEELYCNGEVNVFDEEQYIELLTYLLPEISPDIVIHRLVGDVRDDLLVAPRWKLAKTRVLQLCEERLEKERLSQGCRVKETAGPDLPQRGGE